MRGASVNLPRWGLKLSSLSAKEGYCYACKFTPLGFETLPLFALKLVNFKCKFTPLGFETRWIFSAVLKAAVV